MDDEQSVLSGGIPVSILKETYNAWLENRGYTEKTISVTRGRPLQRLIRYLLDAEHPTYSPVVGDDFIEHEKTAKKPSRAMLNAKRVVYELNSLITGTPVKGNVPRKSPHVSANYSEALEKYILFCKANGNEDTTLQVKRKYATDLIANFEECGCLDLSSLCPEVVLKSSLMNSPVRSYGEYKLFLRFLSENGFTTVDYSALVPSSPRNSHLPDVYSKEEILKLEASFDRSSPKGKRDYAMTVIASRLKLRKCDITGLLLTSLDWEEKCILIQQDKTDNPLRLPMLPEVEEALREYIAVRPESNDIHVFLTTRAPYSRLSAGSMNAIVSAAFDDAGIDTGGREKGPKTLRSSGATHMVNGDIPYSIVSDSLGHSDRDVVKSYARLDIKHLRECALTPPPVTSESFFSRFLEGKEAI